MTHKKKSSKPTKLSKLKNKFINNFVGESNQPKGQKGTNEDLITRRVFIIENRPCTRSAHPNGNCTGNPQCLKGFGEYKEGIWNLSDLNEKDPSELMKKPDYFVGLANLGATCYMNSLLQCLFMNRNFRHAVYMWKGDEEAVESVCYQLQLLFANLQFSNLRYFTPQTLITLLNIRTSIQQDAQEFNKLFVSYLEDQFQRSKISTLSTFIKDEFQGNCAYVTTCKSCKRISKKNEIFYELELNIQNQRKLEGCLKGFLSEENLTGTNQYQCDDCGLVDATRRLKLIDLPPILNFQLIRYTYQAGNKIKLVDEIEFPKTLDMAPYLDGQEKKGEWIYELTGVLMHLGTRANSGHYIAHIRDESTNRWWKFNDSHVTPIDFKEVGEPEPGYDDRDDDLMVYNQRKNQPAHKQFLTVASSAAEKLKKPKISSRDAYMLIYSKRNRPILEAVDPPYSILQSVEQNNANLLDIIADFNTEKQKRLEEINEHKSFYQQILNVAPLDQKLNFHWIDAIWFAQFVRGETELGKIMNDSLLCKHKKVDPNQILRMKQISLEAAKLLYDRFGGGPPLTRDDCCSDCAIALYDDIQMQQERRELRRKMANAAFYPPNPNEKMYWVPRNWLYDWRRQVNNGDRQNIKLNEKITEAITCNHGNLAVTDNKILIPKSVWNYLKDTFDGEPFLEFPQSLPPCPICKEEVESYRQITRARREERTAEKRAVPSLLLKPLARFTPPPPGNYCLIPYLWCSEWRSYIEDVHIPDRPDKIDNTPLLCEHGSLLFDPSVFNESNKQTSYVVIRESDWDTLLNLYGGGPKISVEITKVEQGLQVTIVPGICYPCLKIREEVERQMRLNYEAKRIFIAPKHLGDHYRRDHRNYKRIELFVSSTDTIVMVKLKLMDIINLSPVEQSLSFGETLLADNDKSLAEYSILPGSVLDLVRVERKEEELDDNFGGEEAFEGSLLMSRSNPNNNNNNNNNININNNNNININNINNNDNDNNILIEKEVPLNIINHNTPQNNNNNNNNNNNYDNVMKLSNGSPNNSPQMIDPNQWDCKNCTYLNPMKVSVCGMCNGPRSSHGDWTCNYCTVKNSSSLSRCECCNQPR